MPNQPALHLRNRDPPHIEIPALQRLAAGYAVYSYGQSLLHLDGELNLNLARAARLLIAHLECREPLNLPDRINRTYLIRLHTGQLSRDPPGLKAEPELLRIVSLLEGFQRHPQDYLPGIGNGGLIHSVRNRHTLQC